MSKLKPWVETVKQGTVAILAPTPEKGLSKRSKAEDAAAQNPLMEEGEIIADRAGEGWPRPPFKATLYELPYALTLLGVNVSRDRLAVQFNRIANHHYGEDHLLSSLALSERVLGLRLDFGGGDYLIGRGFALPPWPTLLIDFCSVEAYASEASLAQPQPDASLGSDKPSSWSKINLLNLERSGEFYTLDAILDGLGPDPELTAAEAKAPLEGGQAIQQPAIVLVRVASSETEPWFEDGFGNDLRLMFSDRIKRSCALYGGLEDGRLRPIRIALLKVCSGEDMRMGDVQDERVGPWIQFSVRYISAHNFTQELANFSVTYLNLGIATLTGLPYRCKGDGAQGGGTSLAIRGRGCTHPVLPCDAPYLELQFCSERDTRIGQLDSTCSHDACILDVLDPRARALEKALFEGYIFTFKPASGGQESAGEMPEGGAAPLYSHILRVVSGGWFKPSLTAVGKVYLFCLRQVRQLHPETSVAPSDSFAEYFRLNILRPNVLTGKGGELPGFGLSNPSNAHTLYGSAVASPTGMASHHTKIPASPSVTAETCWLSQILSASMGDALYREKVLASSHIQSIKRLFMSETGASISQFNKHLGELCPSSQEKLAFDSDSLSIIHQQMFLSGLAELIPIWPQVWPHAKLKDFLRERGLGGGARPRRTAELPHPPPPPKGWPIPFPPVPPHPIGLAPFPKHIPPPFPVAPGFRPPGSPWVIPAPRDPMPASHAYLKPDPYAEKSLELQSHWQAQLGDPSNLLYHYWMARKDENITLQPPSSATSMTLIPSFPPPSSRTNPPQAPSSPRDKGSLLKLLDHPKLTLRR
ncbi:hypothetical protein L0F63_003510 [Massospora cicadina]|nr:hypothetical protein L0F63_003510 [Massospora cicadina]